MAIKHPTMAQYAEQYCVECPFIKVIQQVSVEYDPETGHGQMRTLKCEHTEACRRMRDAIMLELLANSRAELEMCYDQSDS